MQEILRIQYTSVTGTPLETDWLTGCVQEIDDDTTPANITISGLLPKTMYKFRLRFEFFAEADSSYNSSATDNNITTYAGTPDVSGDWSNIELGTTNPDAPAKPGDITVVAVTQNSAHLKWDYVLDADTYKVEVSSNNGTDWTTKYDGAGNYHVDTNTYTTTISGLIAGTEYLVRVSAANVTGSSVPSNSTPFMTWPATPGMPIISVVSVTNSTVTLSWTR